ncbi:MAG: hypothetical protein JW990_00150 [Thermoleophilia bacterium]|nr:hypothetical protein [Thermoleophilia bacterium]
MANRITPPLETPHDDGPFKERPTVDEVVAEAEAADRAALEAEKEAPDVTYPYPEHHCGTCAIVTCLAREPGFPVGHPDCPEGCPGSSPCRDYRPMAEGRR